MVSDTTVGFTHGKTPIRLNVRFFTAIYYRRIQYNLIILISNLQQSQNNS